MQCPTLRFFFTYMSQTLFYFCVYSTILIFVMITQDSVVQLYHNLIINYLIDTYSDILLQLFFVINSAALHILGHMTLHNVWQCFFAHSFPTQGIIIIFWAFSRMISGNCLVTFALYFLKEFHMLMDYLQLHFHEMYVHIFPDKCIISRVVSVIKVRSPECYGNSSHLPMDSFSTSRMISPLLTRMILIQIELPMSLFFLFSHFLQDLLRTARNQQKI